MAAMAGSLVSSAGLRLLPTHERGWRRPGRHSWPCCGVDQDDTAGPAVAAAQAALPPSQA